MISRQIAYNRLFVALALLVTLLASAFPVVPTARAAINLKINFQSPNAAIPTGYLRDFGQPYGPRTATGQGTGLIYGWVNPTNGLPLDLATAGTIPGNGRDRGFSPNLDQRLDSLMHMQADDIPGAFNGTKAEGAWEIELPNDTYEVTVAAGDASQGGDPESHTLRVEGTSAISNFLPTGGTGTLTRFRTSIVKVTVNDGKLTVDAVGGTNTKINYIDIVTSTPGPIQPRVSTVTPANSATNVARNTGVSAGVFVPNGGITSSTINGATVFLTRQSDGAIIPSSVNTSGGGDTISLQPDQPLEPNVAYIFHVTNGVRDAMDIPFIPFTSSFTTGQSGGSGGSSLPVSFEQTRNLISTAFFSSLVIGPDSKLYASTLEGYIYRYTIQANGTLSNQQQINTVRTSEGNSNRAIIGMVFDPTSTDTNLILWVSHNGPYVDQGAADWTGQVSRLSGTDLQTIQDYVINLPHSFKDHMVNSIAFRPGQNTTLYINVGSNSAMGATDNAWGQRPERALSASVLKVNIPAITSPPLDVKTEEGGTYNPFAANAPVSFFATGVRNPYDLVWHSNGQLYVPTNGSAAGGNTPASPATLPAVCANRTDGAYTGPAVPTITSVAQIQKDWLFRVVQGGYYGHPNPTRCEWVMNGGNPTAGQGNDGPAEVYEYPTGVQPDRNYRGTAYDFGLNKSPNGAIEYRSNVFGPALQGKLLVVRYSQGKDIMVLEPGGANLDIVASYEGLPGMTGLSNPLDLTEDTRNGNLYVIEFSSGTNSRISLLKPLVGSLAQIKTTPAQLIFTDKADATASATQIVTIENVGTATLNVSGANIIGAGAGAFNIANPVPTSIAPGTSGQIQVNFNPNAPGPYKAILQIASNAANSPNVEIQLRGLGVIGTGGNNEPSLQWILDTYDIPVNVGDPDPTNNALPTTPLLGDEVELQRFERADNANPVIIEPLAIFGPTGTDPITQFGWYAAGNAASKNELFRVSNDPASNGQRIDPSLVTGSTLTFDPGTNVFGFYSIWPFFGNRAIFSEDNLNTFANAIPHHVRVYPLKDSTGVLVPNAYVVATEETTSGFDYQDVVVVVRNVRLASGVTPAPPAAPTNVSAVGSNSQITLNWSAGAGTPAVSYSIYRSTTPTVSTAGAPLATTAATSYVDTTVTNGTLYYYVIVAVAADNSTSPASAVVSARPQNASGTLAIENLDRIPYNDRLVFNRADCCTSLAFHRQSTLRISNIGTTPLNVNSLAISGTDPSWFQITQAANVSPFTIDAGSFRDVTIRFVRDQNFTGPTDDPANPGLIQGPRNAILTISSSDPSKPNQLVELSGYNSPLQGGGNEATLQEIADNFGYGTIFLNPGQSLRTNGSYPAGSLVAVGDEVLSGFWLRANGEEPVYVRQMVASSKTAAGETFRLTGSPTIRHGGNEYQSYLPLNNVVPAGPTEMTITPSTTAPFEIFIGGLGSNRAFADATKAHGVRLWPLRDREGRLVPNSYIVGHDYVSTVGSTAGGVNYDYQDNVYLVTNIRPASIAADPNLGQIYPGSPSLVLEFDNANYPGTLADSTNQTTGFQDTQRDKVDSLRPDQPPTTSYDPSRLTLATSGQGILTIATTDGSNANATNTLDNGLCLAFDGRVTKFNVTTRLLGPLNFTKSFQQAGLMFGPNQSNYIKLVTGVLQTGAQPTIHLAAEFDGVLISAPPIAEVPLPNQASIQSLDLYLTGDPNTGVVEGSYRINDGLIQRLPGSITLTSEQRNRFFDKNANGCVLTTNRLSNTAFNARFDRFAIELPNEITTGRTVLKRYNTGGVTVNAGGVTWQTDAGLFTPTNSPAEPSANPPTNFDVLNTTADRIYQDYRGKVTPGAQDARKITYEIPLNGGPQKVAVQLHFAELFWGLAGRQGPNKRMFDVYAEGKLILNDFDIFAAAGNARTAAVVPIENIQVDDGGLTLMFDAEIDQVSVAAIEVLEGLTGGPIVTAGPDQNVALGANVQLTGSISGFNPPFNFTWQQTAGTPVNLTNATTLTPSFVAPNNFATFVFELRATDSQSLQSADTVEITVGDVPITGLSVASNAPKAINQTVNFTATLGSGVNVTYTWDFGDGSALLVAGATTTHAYTTAGNYQVTVTASNATNTANASTTVVILTVPPFELRINAGGPAYTDSLGRNWIADQNASNPRYSTGTSVFANPNATIANAGANPDIYKTERFGTNFNYAIPMPGAGDYQVILHFAEIFIGAPAPGQPNSTATRRFDVNIIDPVVPVGAEPEINNLNLRQTVGSTTAYSQTFTAKVTDGTLNINLDSRAAAGGTDNAKISGIEIVRIVNQPPLVTAGPDQAVQPGTLVQLTGSVNDPEGAATTFVWAQTAGPIVSLSNQSTLTPSFTPTVKGIYTFKLTGTDAQGGSSSDFVTITVANRAPSVSTSATPAPAEVGNTVTLQATANDLDGDSLTYTWQQTGGPQSVTIANQNAAQASFVAPAKGTYIFQITVSDGDTNGTSVAQLNVVVKNRAPILTPSATPSPAEVNDEVILSANATDLDDDSLTYAWTQTGGPTTTLSNNAAEQPTFIALVKGTYVFEVTVSDGDTDGTVTGTVTVVVNNQLPLAEAGANTSVNVSEVVTLDGRASSDPDGDALTYAWTQTSGALVTLNNADTSTPSFTAPGVATDLEFQLIVTDTEGAASLPDIVRITVGEIAITGLAIVTDAPTVLTQATSFTATLAAGSNVSYSWDFGDGTSATGAVTSHTFSAAGTYTVTLMATNSVGSVSVKSIVTVTNEQPIADANADQDVLVGTLVTLDGSASTDPDDHFPITYQWVQTGGPAVTLTDADTATPSFTAPATSSVLVFQLVVTDSTGLASEPDAMIVIVSDAVPGAVQATNDSPTILGTATTLSVTAVGTNLEYSWDFGDSETGTGAVVTHTYANEGVYVATVTVNNTTGVVGVAMTGVTVSNSAPVADAGLDIDTPVATLTTLDASLSVDPDGHTPLSFAWQQTGGTPVVVNNANSATPSFTAPDQPSLLIFRVTVTDSRGKRSSDVVRINVIDASIAGLSATGTTPTVLGQVTTFTASVANGTNVTYAWSFGDGTSASGPNVQHTFTAAGSYLVTVTASNGPSSSSTSLTIEVTNTAPTAVAGDDVEVANGTLVTLTGSGSDPDGHNPLSFMWRQVSGTPVLANTSGPVVTFTAPAGPAVLVFELTVTDAYGLATTDLVEVRVVRDDRPPPEAPPFKLMLPMVIAQRGSTSPTEPTPPTPPAQADLVISQFAVSPGVPSAGQPALVTVQVTNQGGQATGPFWIDFYINPNRAPTAAGRPWEVTCTLNPCYGVAWTVPAGLQPGQSIVLTSTADSYFADNTIWPGSFTAGTSKLYVFADSWNIDNTAGAVAESNETNNRAEISFAPLAGAPASLLSEAAPNLATRTLR